MHFMLASMRLVVAHGSSPTTHHAFGHRPRWDCPKPAMLPRLRADDAVARRYEQVGSRSGQCLVHVLDDLIGVGGQDYTASHWDTNSRMRFRCSSFIRSNSLITSTNGLTTTCTPLGSSTLAW